MPGFTILDNDEALAADPQSIWMQTDINALVAGIGGDGVISGSAVTAQGTPDMTVAVASGVVRVAGVLATVTAGNVTITTANGSNPRIDLVVVNSSGTKSVTAGTAAASPKAPDIPASSLLLAMVYVPANATAITDTPEMITDKRVVVADALLAAPNVFTAAQTITPATNSTSSFLIAKADATPILNIDTTNARVGINVGAGAPGGTLHVKGTADVILEVAVVSQIVYDTFTAPQFTSYRSRGDSGTPTAVQATDFLWLVGGRGYGDTGFSNMAVALGLRAEETFTDTAQGTFITFETTPIGSTAASRVERLRITAVGAIAINKTASIVGTLHIVPLSSATIGINVQGAASQSGNLQEWRDSSSNPLSTISENGYFTTRKTSAPADAELATGELALWFDSTAGAAKLMIKAKNASGTVVTGSVTLA